MFERGFPVTNALAQHWELFSIRQWTLSQWAILEVFPI
jgi:hypothetical protein